MGMPVYEVCIGYSVCRTMFYSCEKGNQIRAIKSATTKSCDNNTTSRVALLWLFIENGNKNIYKAPTNILAVYLYFYVKECSALASATSALILAVLQVSGSIIWIKDAGFSGTLLKFLFSLGLGIPFYSNQCIFSPLVIGYAQTYFLEVQ